MNTKSEAGNQQRSDLRGDPGVDRTSTAPSRDPQSAVSPITEAPTSVEALEKALAFVAEFKGDGRAGLNCFYSEVLAAEVHRLRAALTTAQAHHQTGEEQESRAALERLVREAAEVYTVETDQAALLRIVARAKELLNDNRG